MRSGVSAGGKHYTRYTDEERARRAGSATKTGHSGSRSGKGHPATSEVEYTRAEWEFMQAVERFQTRTGKKFPTWREVYHVFVALGYEKPAEDEADAGDGPAIVAFG